MDYQNKQKGGNSTNLEMHFFTQDKRFVCFAHDRGVGIACELIIADSATEATLSVEVREKMSAVGKVPGGFSKKELKHKESEVVAATFIEFALKNSIDPNFRHHIKAYVMVENYVKNASIESLAVTAISALMRYAGIPSILVVGEALSCNKNQEWQADGQAALTLAACYQGVRSVFYTGPELPHASLTKGITSAFQAAQNKLQKVYTLLPETKHSPWVTKSQEQHIFPYSPAEIAQLYCENNSAEIAHREAAFLAVWQDKDLGKAKWQSAVHSILQAYLGWKQKRLSPRDLKTAIPVTFQNPLKHPAGCIALKGNSVTSCYCTTLSNESHGIPDSYNGEAPRKLMVQVDIPGGDVREEIFMAWAIRRALEPTIPDDRFTKFSITPFILEAPLLTTAIPGAMHAAKMAGIRTQAPVAVSCVGIASNNTSPTLILDPDSSEQKLLTDANICSFGSQRGAGLVLMWGRLPVSLATFSSALEYGLSQMEPTEERVQPKNKKNGYTIIFSKDNPKLEVLQKELADIEKEIGCSITVTGTNVTLEAGSADALLSVLHREKKDEQIYCARVLSADEQMVHFRLMNGSEGKMKRDPAKMVGIAPKKVIAVQQKGKLWILKAIV